MNPFLGLPHVQSFHGPGCVAIEDDGHTHHASKNPEGGFEKSLTTVDLVGCCIDEVGIADFLQNTTCLRTLRYSHVTKVHTGPQDWNVCKFIAAIEQKVGSHLEELSVFIRELRGSIASGKATIRGFQRLRRLESPLEVAVCNIAATNACRAATTSNKSLVVGHASTDEHYAPAEDELSLNELVPASVSQLSLVSSGTDDHAKALRVIFRHFAARKESTLPALEEIRLSCPASAGDAYKEQCARLLAETEKVGVVMHLERWPSSVSIVWDGEQ